MATETTQDLRAEDFIGKGALVAWLGIKESQRHSFEDKGMPHIRIGEARLYHVPAICAWLKEHEKRDEP